MNFLLKNFKELNYGELLGVNGGCSGSCSGVSGVYRIVVNPNTPTQTNIVVSGDTRISASISTNLAKKTPYIAGVNDCDIWTERVLKEAGFDITNTWGSAANLTVADHEKKLAGKTTDVASRGWSVVLMTDSSKYSTDHCGIVKVESNGSVSFYQNTKSAGGATCEKYSSVAAFQKAYAYSDFDYLKIAN